MPIKLKCESCGHEKTFYGANEVGPEDKFCPLCKGRMRVDNLKEIVAHDMEEHLDRKLKESFEGLGLEGTIQAVKKQDYLYQAYKDRITNIFKRDMFKDVNYLPNKYIDDLTLEISCGRTN